LRLRLRLRVEVEVKGEVEGKGIVKVEVCVYVLYSYWTYKVFLARLLFSQRSAVLAVRPIHALKLK